MPALKTELTEQRPFSEWERAADFFVQMNAAADDPVAQQALMLTVPERYIHSHNNDTF